MASAFSAMSATMPGTAGAAGAGEGAASASASASAAPSPALLDPLTSAIASCHPTGKSFAPVAVGLRVRPSPTPTSTPSALSSALRISISSYRFAFALKSRAVPASIFSYLPNAPSTPTTTYTRGVWLNAPTSRSHPSSTS